MACCLTAPSHYLNQWWLIISKVQWHSSESNLMRYRKPSVTGISLKITYLNFLFKCPSGQWVRDRIRNWLFFCAAHRHSAKYTNWWELPSKYDLISVISNWVISLYSDIHSLSNVSKCWLPVECHDHIWQALPQFACHAQKYGCDSKIRRNTVSKIKTAPTDSW